MASVRLSMYLPVLWSLVGALGRGALRVLGALRDFVLLSGSYPSLTRDPGIAAYALWGQRLQEVRQARPFRGRRAEHDTRAARLAGERLLPYGVGL